MNLTIEDLKEYAKMSATERHGERGRAIRAELDERMRWMPAKWRRLIRCRFILGYSPVKTAMEIHISHTTVYDWTRQIDKWLRDKDAYLNEMT